MIRAVEKVRARLDRAVAALEGAGIPYAVAGGNAVAAWVSRVDEAAVRNTQDVDILSAARGSGASEGRLGCGRFRLSAREKRRHVSRRPGAKARDAIHVIFAGEKVSADYLLPRPMCVMPIRTGPFHVVDLEPLVRMKLTSYRLKDRVHLLDMIDVGLIDVSWPTRFPAELASRLQTLLDNPDS